MTEFWVSQAKHYCKYCSCWIAGNKQTIKMHEGQIGHKIKMENFFKDKRIGKQNAERDEHNNKKAMAEIERAAQQQYQQDLVNMGARGGGGASTVAPRGGQYYQQQQQLQQLELEQFHQKRRLQQLQGGPPPPPPQLQATHTRKLFVGGLAWGTGDAALYDVFGKIGELAEVKVSKSRFNRRSQCDLLC
jgi:WW domain-binding protein 4